MKRVKKVMLGLCLLIGASCLLACSDKENSMQVGPNWDALYHLNEKKAGFDIRVRLKKSYVLGDNINLSVTSPRDGRLWIFYVDPSDRLSVMYPNAMATDNRIEADNALAIPGDSDWEIEAIEPVGHSLLAFIVTTGEKAFTKEFQEIESKDIAELLRLDETAADWALEKHIIEVKAK